MSIRTSKIGALGAAALALPLVIGMGAPALAATPPAGAFAESYGLLVDEVVLPGALDVPISDGPEAVASSSCPGTGGTKSAQLIDVPVDPVVHASALNDEATADCSGPTSKAKSNIVNVDALEGIVDLHADAITATSETSCTKAPTGLTRVDNLSIAGSDISIPLDPPPNFEPWEPLLTPLGLRIIVNEQHPSATGRGLVVNGLHIIATGEGADIPVGGSIVRGDIVLAHAVSGVVCPGGPGSVVPPGLTKPDISFVKNASPSTAKAGDTVTYTAQVTNQSKNGCDVLRFVDHIAPAFTLVSTSGQLGNKFDSPPPARVDGGVDAVLHPTGVTIGAGKTVTQTFTVQVKDDATPGTYYDTLEIFCGANGNFVSGPLAPVTVTAPGAPQTPGGPAEQPPGDAFAPTGLNTGVAGAALLLLIAAAGTRRLQLSRRG